jgi:hypothetical protein
MDMNASDRFTWTDLPALLLAGVSALTVTTGATLLRGQNPIVMLALGLGVAGAMLVLDKLLIERLNAIRPRQSLLALLICWAPLFLFATALATLATFSWVAPEIARRDLDDGRRAHWTQEANKVAAYLLQLKSALRQQLEGTQVEIDAERRRAAAARREGVFHAGEPQQALQRRLRASRELEARVTALPPLPLAGSTDETGAPPQIERAYRDLADVHASAALVLRHAPVLPAYGRFTPPSADLQSIVAEETRKRSWRAITAWGAALWVELLPLLALWRGGRKVPLATRILQWRGRAEDTMSALRGGRTPTPLPIVIEPLQVRGVVHVGPAAEYTLTDFTPLLEEAVGTLTGVLGCYHLSRVSNASGDDLDESRPLLPQLNGQPLVLSVVEGHS